MHHSLSTIKDQLTGYDIDVIKAVAKAENLKLKFNETSWDSMFAGLDAGRFDVIANKLVSIKTEKKYKFSDHTHTQVQY